MTIDQLAERVSNPVQVEARQLYTQIGIRSHGKGLFHKKPITGQELGNKRVFWVTDGLFVVNIVFAWEQAVAKTTKNELGTIASHRFPMFRPRRTLLDLDFMRFSFLTKRGKSLLEIASPGGAGRNKTLGQEEFSRIKINVPSIEEQQKIATLHLTVDEKIRHLAKKKELLLKYKKGVLVQILDQKIRFRDRNGIDFPDWQEKRLGEIVECLDNQRIPLNQAQRESMQGDIPYWGANNIVDYINEYIFDEDLVLLAEDGGNFEEYETRPIANFSSGKSWVNNHAHVLRAKGQMLTKFLYYALVHKNILGFVNSGTRSKLNKSDMLVIKVTCPSLKEQKRISEFLSFLDDKVNVVDQELQQVRTLKKGLLQQMFV